MAANIKIRDVSITPNPVQTSKQYTISVSVDELNHIAYTGSYVGSYVNIMDSERASKLPLAYVGDYTDR